jgi:hypothetical protein
MLTGKKPPNKKAAYCYFSAFFGGGIMSFKKSAIGIILVRIKGF